MGFDHLNFRILQQNDFDEVWNFLVKEYFTREPMCALSKFTPEEADMYLGDYVRDAVIQNVSIGAYDKKTNDLIGVRISILGTIPRKFVRSSSEYPLKVRQATELLTIMLDSDQVHGTNKYMHFLMLCSRSDCSNAGIGTELYRRGEEIARRKGCKKIFTLAINVFTLKIGEKNGYKIKKEIVYKDYVDPLTGNKPYESIESPHVKIALIVKDLD